MIRHRRTKGITRFAALVFAAVASLLPARVALAQSVQVFINTAYVSSGSPGAGCGITIAPPFQFVCPM
jgi:hypothetical protein